MRIKIGTKYAVCIQYDHNSLCLDDVILIKEEGVHF